MSRFSSNGTLPLLALVVSGVGGAILAAFAQSRQTEIPRVQADASSTNFSAYEQRLRRIEVSVSDIQRQLLRITETLDSVTASAHSRSKANKSGLPDRALLPPPTFEERSKDLEYAMSATSRNDLGWSVQTELQIASKIAGSEALSAANSYQARCAATLCNVSAVLPEDMNPLDREFYLDKLLASLAADLPVATSSTRDNPDGSTELVVYLARSGFDLPDTENPTGRKLPEAVTQRQKLHPISN